MFHCPKCCRKISDKQGHFCTQCKKTFKDCVMKKDHCTITIPRCKKTGQLKNKALVELNTNLSINECWVGQFNEDLNQLIERYQI